MRLNRLSFLSAALACHPERSEGSTPLTHTLRQAVDRNRSRRFCYLVTYKILIRGAGSPAPLQGAVGFFLYLARQHTAAVLR
jgi:hypothetical protein